MRFTGLGFADAAARVDEIIRNVKPDSVSPKREMTDGERLAALRALWAETRKAEKGDLLHAYLASRGISVDGAGRSAVCTQDQGRRGRHPAGDGGVGPGRQTASRSRCTGRS